MPLRDEFPRAIFFTKLREGVPGPPLMPNFTIVALEMWA